MIRPGLQTHNLAQQQNRESRYSRATDDTGNSLDQYQAHHHQPSAGRQQRQSLLGTSTLHQGPSSFVVHQSEGVKRHHLSTVKQSQMQQSSSALVVPKEVNGAPSEIYRQRDSSPNKARMEVLKEKFAAQHQEMQMSQQAQQSSNLTFDSKAHELQEKLVKCESRQETKVQIISGMIEKLNDQAQTSLGSTQISDEKKHNEIRQSDTMLQFELAADRQHRKESESRIAKSIDEKLFNLKLDLAKEKKAREESQDCYENTLGAQLSQLSEAINEENLEREENSQHIVGILSEEIGKFHVSLQNERKEREQAQQSMFRMLEDIHVRLNDNLEQEIRMREETEEKLIKLLEETCLRVEKSLQSQ